jgi:hypothetical protein
VATLERSRPRAAALALWAGLLIFVGAVLPWFAFAAVVDKQRLDWTGTEILWGLLPFVAGWVLTVDAARHVRADTGPNLGILGVTVSLAAISLVGAWVVGIPLTETHGVDFQSIHVGVVVELVGIALGGLAFRINPGASRQA